MGCGWKSIAGKRVRVGAVSAPLMQTPVALSRLVRFPGVTGVLSRIIPTLSPAVDWDNTEIRLWLDPEKGYMSEVRIPGHPLPIYHRITDDEARSIQANRPTPELMTRLVTFKEPPLE